MARFRRAAAVVLTRGEGLDLEVYLIQRARALRFYGGYWAFPGGVVDDELDVRAFGEAPTPVATQTETSLPSPEDRRQRARCAARELFEEVDVLLDPRDLAPGQRSRLRAALNARTPSVAERALRSEGWGAVARRLRVPEAVPDFARVLTPPFSARRYDTTFHHARLPEGEAPAVDGSEAVQGEFVRPAELLAAWRRGERYVVPPTLQLLGHFERHGLEGGLTAARASSDRIAQGQLTGACQSPGILVAPLRTPTIPPATTTNTFLVGAETTYVVDPATYEEDERARLFELCDAVRGEGRRIAGVLLTHHHHDHVGSVRETALRYGVPVCAHPETLGRLELDGLSTRVLDDGDRLPLGTAPDGSRDWNLRVLFTPGHAPGHLAFVESALRGALVGDLVSTLSTIVIDPPEGHLATYLASLRRLVEADIRILHPAHGLPTRDGVRVVEAYLEHRAARERTLLEALTEVPRSADELVPVVYEDTAAELHPLARRSLEAGLEKLVEDGLARERQAGWVRISPGATA